MTCTLFLAALLAGCQSMQEAPDRAQITQEVVTEATVLSVDPATREIVLDAGDGAHYAFVAGPEVRNFDQIAVGEVVTAGYTQTLAARLLGTDEMDTESAIGVVAGRAEAGAKPGGAIGMGASTTVVVQSVDKKQNLVVFADPEGLLHAVRAERDVGKRFVAGLKPGDRVELVFGESIVLSVE